MKTRNALLSVYHKDGIAEFAQALVELNFTIYASGGTFDHLTEKNIPALPVASLVGGGAILGHKVVTLSREVHAALLADFSDEEVAELANLKIPRFDLVCVDLYPLKEEIARPGSTRASVIKQTDIGGPTMIRSGVKGDRLVICDPSDRATALAWLKAGEPEDGTLQKLAAKGEFVIAKYCMASASYRSGDNYLGIFGELVLGCKYGENAWQAPAHLYSTGADDPLAIHKFLPIGGTEASANNLFDLDRALQTLTHVAAVYDVNDIRDEAPMIAIGVKHGNACGVGLSFPGEASKAVFDMMKGDKDALMGGVMLTNFPITTHSLTHMMGHKFDLIAAPAIDPKVIEGLERKHGKCRFMVNPALEHITKESIATETRFRQVRGGFVRQPNYTFVPDLKADYMEKFGEELVIDLDGMLLAWAIGSTSTSNTITIVKAGALLGNGVGQQDRVGAAKLAVERAKKAGHEGSLKGAVAYSDSFFPFPDGPEILINAGIRAIFTTSGSVNDKATIELCREKGVTLYMMPDKIGRGFYGH